MSVKKPKMKREAHGQTAGTNWNPKDDNACAAEIRGMDRVVMEGMGKVVEYKYEFDYSSYN
jgi:hypothetical protein